MLKTKRNYYSNNLLKMYSYITYSKRACEIFLPKFKEINNVKLLNSKLNKRNTSQDKLAYCFQMYVLMKVNYRNLF